LPAAKATLHPRIVLLIHLGFSLQADANAMKAHAALHRLGQGVTVTTPSVSYAATAWQAAADLKVRALNVHWL
jgi:hypothetical protein